MISCKAPPYWYKMIEVGYNAYMDLLILYKVLWLRGFLMDWLDHNILLELCLARIFVINQKFNKKNPKVLECTQMTY